MELSTPMTDIIYYMALKNNDIAYANVSRLGYTERTRVKENQMNICNG